MFILGLLVGLSIAALIGMAVSRRQSRQLAALQSRSSSQFRRITALENELAGVKAAGAQAVRDEKLRNEREFIQYKTLLRRADAALSKAKVQRDQADGLEQAA